MSRLIRNWIDMPPVWLLGFIALIWVQVDVFNPFGFDLPIARLAGWGLIVLAVVLMLWAASLFKASDTSIVPRQKPRALIARGPYRLTRNPIYLADAMALLATALILGSVIGVLLVPVFMFVITTRFIKGEEAGLKEIYPESSAAFFNGTRRWL